MNNRMLMRSYLLLAALVLAALAAPAQDRCWVFFTDKGAGAAPALSAEALASRAHRGIPLDAADLPVWPGYLEALRSQGIEPLGASRWLNAALVSGEGAARLRAACPAWVREVRPEARLRVLPAACAPGGEAPDYGDAAEQNQMLGIEALHARGITGKGVVVAVFDGGFSGVDTIAAFRRLREEGRILGTYDFVDGDSSVYASSAHGTQVLSTIAAELPGRFVGMAPGVSVLLARTEDVSSETQVEEYNWVRAMEWADSLGADIIHSSLGYTEYDDGVGDYVFSNLDGDQAIITRAADLAASRGIIVTVSAGNLGTSEWRRIAAPCDGDSVLCVGAVDRTTRRASFSSVGPSADGRVKPDVAAMGQRTAVVNPNGRVGYSSGTSFSAPIVAGLAACLREAHAERPGMDIVRAIRLSGDQYGLPDSLYGYGIPSAGRADSLLATGQDLAQVQMVHTERPQRGQAKPAQGSAPVRSAPPSPALTPNPQSRAELGGGQLLIRVPAEANLRKVSLFQGGRAVHVNPRDLSYSSAGLQMPSGWLLPGVYEALVETDRFTERIAFTIE
jgi:hypothetical protein